MIPIARIVIATDFSALASRTLRVGLALAKTLGASTELLHVVEEPEGVSTETALQSMGVSGPRTLTQIAEDDARQRLRQHLSELSERPASVSVEVRHGKARHAIVQFARECGADLLIVGTHGRSGLGHALMGSVAEGVIRSAPCPVLTVPVGGTPDTQSHP